MNVLWITNKPLTEAVSSINGTLVGKVTESWVSALADTICQQSNINLFVASVYTGVGNMRIIKGKIATHFLIPSKRDYYRYHKEYEHYWQKVKEIALPDVVHIHGTERPLGLSYVKSCGAQNVVVSLQGIVTEIEKYYYAGLSQKNSLKYISIHDILMGSLPSQERKHFKMAGAYERELLNSVHFVIGRTMWDKVHALSINPSLSYFKCNEIMRKEFYCGTWKYSDCSPFSILMSQANTPLKGAHIAIEAMTEIVKRYPAAKLNIAGSNPIQYASFKDKIRIRTYGKYLKSLISRLGMSDCVNFIGYQSSQGMKESLLKTNLFLSASSIENSSNSLGEAQLLGVPCVASYVGGTADFIPDDSCGEMYRYDDREMLANIVCKMFEKSSLFDNSRMKDVALRRHNVECNVNTLLNCYKQVMYSSL